MSRKGEDQTLLICTFSTWMKNIVSCRWLHIIPNSMTCFCVWIIARSAKYNYMSNLDVLGYTCAENSITCCSYSLSLHQTIRENRINHLMRLVLLFIFVSSAILIFWESLQCVFLVECLDLNLGVHIFVIIWYTDGKDDTIKKCWYYLNWI